MASSLNTEKLFISKLIFSGEFAEAAGIQPFMFSEEKYATALEYIRDYYMRHQMVPTERVFHADCPNVPLVQVDEPWSDLRERLWEQWQRGKLTGDLNEIVNIYQSDVKEAVRLMALAVSDIYSEMPTSRDIDITENGDERLARYEDRKNNPDKLVGIPTGFQTIDKATQGLQPGQLVVVTGLPKASKSTLGMKLSMNVQEFGKRVLYLTYEQTVEEQERRLDAYRAGFNDNLLNSGQFNDIQYAALTAGIEMTSNLPAMLISQDCMTVSEIAAKADSFNPDVIVVDGVYMMDDERSGERNTSTALANIVASLKFMAMRRNICIVAITQSTPARTKSEKLNSDSVMGSRAFSQYANVLLGIERFEATLKFEHRMMRKLRILLSRSCPTLTVPLDWDYDKALFQENHEYVLEEDGYDEPEEDYEESNDSPTPY